MVPAAGSPDGGERGGGGGRKAHRPAPGLKSLYFEHAPPNPAGPTPAPAHPRLCVVRGPGAGAGEPADIAGRTRPTRPLQQLKSAIPDGPRAPDLESARGPGPRLCRLPAKPLRLFEQKASFDMLGAFDKDNPIPSPQCECESIEGTEQVPLAFGPKVRAATAHARRTAGGLGRPSRELAGGGAAFGGVTYSHSQNAYPGSGCR
jgi:hypothetical protein